MLRSHFGEGTYPFKTELMQECPTDNKQFELLWQIDYKVDNTKSKQVLNIKYHPMKETLGQMATHMIESGDIPDHRAKK